MTKSKSKKPTGPRVVPMRRHPRARAFEAWCRRQGIRPGEPTPAVVSPSLSSNYRYHYATLRVKGIGRTNIPPLETTREAFCFNLRRSFVIRSGDSWYDFYDAHPDRSRDSFLNGREFVHCPHCGEEHLLLQAGVLQGLGLIEGWGKKDRRFSWTLQEFRKHLDFKKFPAIPRDSLEFSEDSPFSPHLKPQEKARRVVAQRKAS